VNSSKDTLVASIKCPADRATVSREGWYAMPAFVERVPAIIRANNLRHIAFYPAGLCEDGQFTITEYAAVEDITVAKRKELYPSPASAKAPGIAELRAGHEYFRIALGPIRQLPAPIISRKGRSIHFIETTLQKLEAARELNDLYYENMAEETLWSELLKRNILAERKYYLPLKNRRYFLDFAIFCRYGRINIECSGGYFDEQSSAQLHFERNTLLHRNGWTVIRITPDDIFYDTEDALLLVSDTIQKLGGLEDQPAIVTDKTFSAALL
jgi:very-short-patch-repair endonuclease